MDDFVYIILHDVQEPFLGCLEEEAGWGPAGVDRHQDQDRHHRAGQDGDQRLPRYQHQSEAPLLSFTTKTPRTNGWRKGVGSNR